MKSNVTNGKHPLFPNRELGLLLHPTSFFNREDVGTLGRHAYRFVDWLEQAGITLWQILPLTPNGLHDSPYFSYSAFAGNPWLIDLELLSAAGLLDDPALHDEIHEGRVPFESLPQVKLPKLLEAARAFLEDRAHPWRRDFLAFCKEQPWLAETAHFFALKGENDDLPWWEWKPKLRQRRPKALAASREALLDQIMIWKAIFYFADRQWGELKAYAASKKIRILGDLPIYVNHDSADVWINQDQFKLDENGQFTVQSGVPPDYFSETGQLWGNPIYDWAAMEADGFSWWMARLRRCIELTDLVRIDHFRALSAYWEIPGDAADARSGTWVQGPGQAFFDVLRENFPTMPFVAEDLGTLDDAVHQLRDENGLYGMRILQFGFDGMPDNPHRPHVFGETTISYTGTHDNDTIAGWWAGLSHAERQEVANYYQFQVDDSLGRIVWSLIEANIACRANVAVVPIQDCLVLDHRARMNDPSHFNGNWAWRMPANGLSDGLAHSLRALRDRYRPPGQLNS